MSIWDRYPNLTADELRTLATVTAQVLLESDEAAAELAPDFLQQSPSTSARQVTPLLAERDPTVSQQRVREVLEDEELATRICRAVLDQARAYPELADRVAREYEARQQKMTGVELVLAAGALVVLATRIKRLRWGPEGGEIVFEPAGKAVEAFLAGLLKSLPGQP